MAVTYTPEQQKVIELQDRNILVSAAAGSGKTAVLVERILRIICDETKKVDIDRLLVVTFTNAAAAQMRERISIAIGRKLQENPENEHLQRQAALVHNAQITTIDSFCLFVIRNNFNDIGLDPGFRVADEGELKLLKQDVLTELLEEKYGTGEEQERAAFLSCVEYFTGGSNDRLLEEYVEKLYEFSMSCPWPEEWLTERGEDYSITDVSQMENSSWCRYLTDYIRNAFAECAQRLSEATGLAEQPGGPYFYGELLEREREQLAAIAEKDSLTALYEGCSGFCFGRLPGKKDDSVEPALREKAQAIRNSVKKQVEEIRTAYFSLSPEQLLQRMTKAAAPVEELTRLVLEFKRKLDERKRKEAIIDFHDMEHMALQILLEKKEDGSAVASPAALEYRQFFYEILIDEYQDSNLVQELLLQSVSGEEEGHFNRFMVGDVKQSIYKFRLARPELFIEKYNCYSKVDSVRQRIDLHKNFRSRPEVLESVNHLFYRLMGEKLGGISYDEDAALYPGAAFPDYGHNETEVLLIEKDSESELTVREQEAVVIARRIKELVREFQVTDKETGKLRSARYRDIVVLLRTTSGWAEEFKRVFEKEGVPAYVASRTGYFQTTEVRELLQLLHAIDNPLQDIPLYGTLKSFFGGFSEEEIALLCSREKRQNDARGGRGSFLAEDLASYQGEAGLKEKADGFLQWIGELRRRTSYTPIHMLLQEILTETGYLEYVTARPGGNQRRANVEMLLTRAAAFEHTSYYGLFHFLRYMEQLEKYQVDYGEADILDENADVVRIMSIHKSKGLEFPICFVAGLSKKFNRQDTAGRLIADIDMGIGVDYVDSERRLQSRTLRKNGVALKIKLDSLGEELRVLYVAMTRAMEKLFLTGMVTEVDKLYESMEDGLPLSFLTMTRAGSFLDFILPCLRVSQVKWVSPGDLFADSVEDILRLTDTRHALSLAEVDNELMTQLSEKFKRQYPYHYLRELFVKTSVSELKKAAAAQIPERSMNLGGEKALAGVREEAAFTKQLYEEPEIVPYLPNFRKEKEGISGTDRGSAYHKVMELLQLKYFAPFAEGEYEAEPLKQEIRRQIREMVEAGKLSVEWAESVSVEKLALFLQSSLAKRMIRADGMGRLFREKPFVLGLPAGRLNPAFPMEETVLIQGIIDIYFEEEGKIIVADYKTDRVGGEEELIRRYRIQLAYYGEALARLTEKPVAEKLLYSFSLGKEIAVWE